MKRKKRRHDSQHKDTFHNDTQHTDLFHNDTQNEGTVSGKLW